MRNVIFILILFVTVNVISQGDSKVSPKITIKILLGETIQLENHTITFKKVLEDSRCPKEVTCVWAGRAKVLIEISKNGKEAFEKELIFGQLMEGESSDMTLFTNNNNQVLGMTLNPHPNSGEAIERANYVLLVYIEKINDSFK